MHRLLIAAATVVVLAAGYAVADAEDLVPGFLTLTPAVASGSGNGPSTRTPPPGGPTSDAGWPALLAQQPVLLAPSTTAAEPSAATLSRLLGVPIGRLGAGGSGSVVDIATGHVLYSHKASTPRTPASTTKLLTAVSVLSALDPQSTLSTRVVRGAGAGQIVLVGGGDDRLSAGAGSATAIFGHAGLGDLATATAAALKTDGTHRVSLGFDDSIFSGPRMSSRWAKSDPATGQIEAITPLALAAKAPAPGKPSPADPSLAAAQAFATDLARQGVTVVGRPRRVRAAGSATELAVVHSATIGQLLNETLTVSDNTEAEVLARLAARAAGRPGSFAGADAQILHAAAALDVPISGVRLYDASGLARADLIAPQTLTSVLTQAASSSRPELHAFFAGLPIAGLTGTLAPRYADARTRAAAGVVRAKTGTLNGVDTLAGLAVDADGRLLAFAFMASHPTGKTPAARPLLDRATAILAGCGCR